MYYLPSLRFEVPYRTVCASSHTNTGPIASVAKERPHFTRRQPIGDFRLVTLTRSRISLVAATQTRTSITTYGQRLQLRGPLWRLVAIVEHYSYFATAVVLQ